MFFKGISYVTADFVLKILSDTYGGSVLVSTADRVSRIRYRVPEPAFRKVGATLGRYGEDTCTIFLVSLMEERGHTETVRDGGSTASRGDFFQHFGKILLFPQGAGFRAEFSLFPIPLPRTRLCGQ